LFYSFKCFFLIFLKKTKPIWLVGPNPTGPARPGPTVWVDLVWLGSTPTNPLPSLPSHPHARVPNRYAWLYPVCDDAVVVSLAVLGLAATGEMGFCFSSTSSTTPSCSICFSQFLTDTSQTYL
jgi:hypothetical protein